MIYDYKKRKNAKQKLRMLKDELARYDWLIANSYDVGSSMLEDRNRCLYEIAKIERQVRG